jgi:hypothetical protein
MSRAYDGPPLIKNDECSGHISWFDIRASVTYSASRVEYSRMRSTLFILDSTCVLICTAMLR